MDKIMEKLSFLDGHHKMERFSVLFLVFAVILAACFGIGFKTQGDLDKAYLSSVAIYAQESSFSLTNSHINVINLYRNSDYTRAFLLLKVTSDMRELPTKADDYMVYMTTEKGEKVSPTTKLSLYMFGSTGYIGLYFVDNASFNSGIYDIILRNTNIISATATPDPYSNDHFKKFNDAEIKVNLRGESGEVAEFLSYDNPSAVDIYSGVILREDISDVITDLNTTLIDMNNEMYRVNVYAKDLKDYGIKVPTLPMSVANDVISVDPAVTKDNPCEFNPDMVDDIKYYLKNVNYYNTVIDSSTEENKARYISSDLYLKTDFVFPGGFQFNYQDISITNGILSKVKPSSLSFDEWLAQKDSESALYSKKVSASLNPNSGDWEYDNNLRFVYNSSTATVKEKEIYTTITNYCESVNNLISLKKSYQVDSLRKLVRLENDAISGSGVFSVNAGDTNLVIY